MGQVYHNVSLATRAGRITISCAIPGLERMDRPGYMTPWSPWKHHRLRYCQGYDPRSQHCRRCRHPPSDNPAGMTFMAQREQNVPLFQGGSGLCFNINVKRLRCNAVITEPGENIMPRIRENPGTETAAIPGFRAARMVLTANIKPRRYGLTHDTLPVRKNPVRTLYCILATTTILSAACTTDVSTKTDETRSPVAKTESAGLCTDMGPQAPRDISNGYGLNAVQFTMAPAATEMNLCNIHTHTNAEHKGPGFTVFVNNTDNGGYACNGTVNLTAEELRDPYPGKAIYKGVKPGDTIEVHWVHTSCDVTPGKGLGSCLSDMCKDPLLRVEAQVFLVVNNPVNALDFTGVAYNGTIRNGKHQAEMIPSDTGDPVVFRGSTTGPGYNQSTCSPLNVTWSVRPECMHVDIGSLHRWSEQGNVFKETKSHGVRQLVTAPELLSPIE